MSRVFTIEKYSREFLIDLLKKMILIRRFEEKAGQMYGLQKIGGFCHLYIGQEAVAVGSIAALDLSEDYVLTTYRDHGHCPGLWYGSQGVNGRTLWQDNGLFQRKRRVNATF